MKIFRKMDAGEYAAGACVFARSECAGLFNPFWNYIANCVSRALESGDRSHLNKAARAAEFCGYSRTFRNVVPRVAPFSFDREAMLFVGHIGKDKREMLQDSDKDGVRAWEKRLKLALEGKTEPTEFASEPSRQGRSRRDRPKVFSGGLPSLGKRR